MRTLIFVGRFQPFHVGHYYTVERIVSQMYDEDRLVVGVISEVVSSQVSEILSRDYYEATQEHQIQEKNPWPVGVRLEAVHRVIEDLGNRFDVSRVLSCAILRPSLYLRDLRSWFPGNRVWVLPNVVDDLEERKRHFFEEQGEIVLNLGARERMASGSTMRELLYDGRREEFERFVPSCLLDFYRAVIY